MARHDVYLRLPVPEDREPRFIRVDFDRLDKSALGILYERSKTGSGRSPNQYVRILGSECWLNTPADTSEIKGVARDILDQISVSLQGFGQAGKMIQEQILDPFCLEPFIDALAKSDSSLAAEELQALLYAFMGGLGTIANELSHTDQLASGMTLAFEAEQASVDDSKAFRDNLYLEIAALAEKIIKTVEKLKELESKLEMSVLEIDEALQQWTNLIDTSNPQILEASNFLDGDDSFILRAFNYRREPEKYTISIVEGDIKTAEHHSALCRKNEENAVGIWAEKKEYADNQVLPESQSIKLLTQSLAEIRKRFNDILAMLPADSPKAFMVLGSIISKETYQKAEKLLKDSHWSTEAWGCQRRLESLVESALSLVKHRPRLPKTLVSIVGNAEDAIKELKKLLERSAIPTSVVVEVQPQEISRTNFTYDTPESRDPVANLELDETTPVTSHQIECNPQRLEQLYELLICVGYVATCNNRYVSSSRVHTLLRIMTQANLCSEAEAIAYSESIKERVKENDSERIEDTKKTKVSDRWEKSKARWLIYDIMTKPPRWGAIKLTRCSMALALSLMTKYGLKEDQISLAHKQFKEITKEKFLLRRKNYQKE